MEYSLKRRYSGEGHDYTITPTCSCGWVGIGYPAWNDYQHAMVNDQETEHTLMHRREERALNER